MIENKMEIILKTKLDIFKILAAIDDNDKDFINYLSEEELKIFSPYITAIWLYGASDYKDERIFFTNHFVNPYIHKLDKHPKLLFFLMCVANGFGHTFHNYPKIKDKISHPISLKILQEYYSCKIDVAKKYLTIHEPIDIIDLAEQLGYQKDLIKKLENEYLK